MRSLEQAIIAALIATAVLTSCSDDDPLPAETTAAPTTAATTVSPSATPPPHPVVATADPAGAEAFVRYFWDVFNYSYASGDTKLLRSISANTCKFCKSAGDHVDSLHKRAARSEGGQVRIDRVFAVPPEIAAGAIFTLRIDQEAGRSVASDGQVLGSGAAIVDQVVEMVLKYDGKWAVYGVEIKDGAR